MARYLIATGRLASLMLAGLALYPWSMTASSGDSREPFSRETLPWLQSVGKLLVPGQRYRDGRTAHYLEDCSATLVALPHSIQAETILTAWHCLEFYQDLSRPITFTATTASGDILQREARRLTDGGGMHADWALLRLNHAVPTREVPALIIHPGSADPERPVTMAGFSRDKGIGELGQVLTFDPACAITFQDRELGETNCYAFKGASGGAVIQLSGAGEPRESLSAITALQWV